MDSAPPPSPPPHLRLLPPQPPTCAEGLLVTCSRLQPAPARSEKRLLTQILTGPWGEDALAVWAIKTALRRDSFGGFGCLGGDRLGGVGRCWRVTAGLGARCDAGWRVEWERGEEEGRRRRGDGKRM